MRSQDTIAEAILATKPLAARYFAGFTDANHTTQTPGLPNHLAWSLGHLAHTMHRTAEKIDGLPLPDSDMFFGATDPARMPGATPTRFCTEDVSFNSKPTADPSRYPSLARCIEIYYAGCDRVAAAVRAASDSKLDEVVKWGAGETTLRSLGSRMVFHNGMHIGQIADLRRALGFKSIFS